MGGWGSFRQHFICTNVKEEAGWKREEQTKTNTEGVGGSKIEHFDGTYFLISPMSHYLCINNVK